MTLRRLEPIDPHEYVMRLALGHVASRVVHSFAHFRIADHLAAGGRTLTELASFSRTHEPSMLRLLRAATALQLLAEEPDDRFVLTPFGAALHTAAPRHAASATLAMGGSTIWNAFGEFIHSVETGDPVLERSGGPKLFSEAETQASSRTAETMIAFYGNEPFVIAEAYDFSAARVVADIGGSSGNLLSTLLAQNPGMRGILFDLPPIAPTAKELLARRGVADRCEVISGSFFEAVPGGADLYLVSHVIHDWPLQEAETILKHIRRAIPAQGRLLVIEPILTPDAESDVAKLLDVIALAITGGRHRTLDDHQALLARGGFRLTRVIDTAASVSIIESEPV